MTGKECRDCGVFKPYSEFPQQGHRSDGRGSYCLLCMNTRSKASYRRRREAEGKPVRERLALPGFRRCPDCNEVKLLAEFPRSKNAPEGRGGYCKPCHNARGKASKQRLYGGTRHYHLTQRYGISAAEVDALLDAQGGRCLICEERPAAHVDHDHATGQVRGLLCFGCNGGLGQFRDRVDIMRKAIDYLEEHGA